MKKLFLLVAILGLFEFNLKAQDTIYEKRRGNDNWKTYGKCENGFLYKKKAFSESWQLVGKYEGGNIFLKQRKKN